MKYRLLTLLSIISIILILLFQGYLAYNLFSVNKSILNQKLNDITNEACKIELNLRLSKIANLSGSQSVEYFIQPIGSTADITPFIADTSIVTYDMRQAPDSSADIVSLLNQALSEYANEIAPFNLNAMDSIVGNLLENKGISSEYSVKVIETKTGNVLESTKNISNTSPFFLIESKSVSLSSSGQKSLQVSLMNPQGRIFREMSLFLLSSLLLSILSIYCIWHLQQLYSRQKELSEVKNTFFSHISHELKRPVSVIYKAVDSLLSNPGAAEDKTRREKYLNISKGELKNITGKINMIVALSMEEEGVFNLHLSEFNLIELVESIKDKLSLSNSKPVFIEINNLLEKPFVHADEGHLSQCIANLIENAIKYSGERVNILISLKNENNGVSIAVKDDGLGIASDKLNHIFEKYNRVGADGKISGYGIGLHYVKQIVEKHHGKIKVTSEINNGSEFIIYLP